MIVIRLSFLFLLLNCTSTQAFKNSNHYNSSQKKFFNPGHENEEKSLLSMIQWKFFTDAQKWPDSRELNKRPKLEIKLNPEEINLTFVNHSTFLIQFDGLNVLTDPVWSKRVSPVSWAGPQRVHHPGIKFDQLPKIDIVIVSHNHYDHMDLNTLERLERKFSPVFVVPLGDKLKLSKLGIEKVFELDWWENIKFNEFEIVFTPAKHWSKRSLFDRNDSLWGSFIISKENKSVYFAGDTGYSKHFKEIASRFKNISLSLLPIGAYAPRWFMQSMHMDPEEAVWAHKDLNSKQSIGMHFGTFQLTNE